MINQDLLKYIENEKAKGLSKETIHSNLLANGWNEKDIIEAFSTIILENNHTVSDTPVIEKKWRRLKNFLRLNIKKIILTIFLIFFAPIPLFLLFAFVSQPPIKYLLGLTLVTNVLGGIFTILIFVTESFFCLYYCLYYRLDIGKNYPRKNHSIFNSFNSYNYFDYRLFF